MNLAWAAGFFDGEGCICLARRFRKGKIHPEYELKLSVGQANPKPLELFSKSFGGNVNKRGDGYYIWQLSSEDSIKTLGILIPHLILKKDEAIEALKFGELMVGKGGNITDENRHSRKKLYEKIKKYKDQYKGNDQWKL